MKPEKLSFILPVIVALTMFNNLEHAAVVYHSISVKHFETEWLNWVQPIFVNLVIDMAVIVFVIKGKTGSAAIYTVAILFVNLLYYNGLGLFDQQTIIRAAQLIYSIMFTGTIYIFSEMYFSQDKTQQQVDHERNERWKANKQLEEVKNELKQSNSELTENRMTIKELQSYQEALKCPICGHQSKTIGEFEYHRRKEHKNK